MRDSTDEFIISVVKNDKSQGLRLIFEKYYAMLVIFAQKLMKDAMVAEDIVQDMFVKLWNLDYLFHLKSKELKPYLYTSVRNAAINHIKRNAKQQNNVDFLSTEAAEENELFDEEKITIIYKSIQRLPERTRMAVEKVMIERQKYQDAADSMDISINTLKYLLKDGLKKLRAELHSVDLD